MIKVKLKQKQSQPYSTKYWQSQEAAGSLVHALWECKTIWSLWKVVWQSLIKLNT